MRILTIAALPVAAIALAGCAQVVAGVQSAVHPIADRYCAEVPVELRHQVREVMVTPEGNQIIIECAADGSAIQMALPK